MEIKDFCKGVQHIGIPTNDIEKTKAFFAKIGFEVAFSTINGTEKVAFLRLGNLVIETYQNGQAAMKPGAVDHICIDVKNIDELFPLVKAAGFEMLDDKINFLPFWDNGVKFFTVMGPDKEKIEFCEMMSDKKRA